MSHSNAGYTNMARGNTKKYIATCELSTVAFTSASIFLVDQTNCDVVFCIDKKGERLNETIVAKGFAAQTTAEAFAIVASGTPSSLGPRPRVESIIGSIINPKNTKHVFFVCATKPGYFDDPQDIHRVSIGRLLGPRRHDINGVYYLLHPRMRYLKRPSFMELARLASKAPAQCTVAMVHPDDLLTIDEHNQLTHITHSS